jgi:hypothetical protein
MANEIAGCASNASRNSPLFLPIASAEPYLRAAVRNLSSWTEISLSSRSMSWLDSE